MVSFHRSHKEMKCKMTKLRRWEDPKGDGALHFTEPIISKIYAALASSSGLHQSTALQRPHAAACTQYTVMRKHSPFLMTSRLRLVL